MTSHSNLSSDKKRQKMLAWKLFYDFTFKTVVNIKCARKCSVTSKHEFKTLAIYTILPGITKCHYGQVLCPDILEHKDSSKVMRSGKSASSAYSQSLHLLIYSFNSAFRKCNGGGGSSLLSTAARFVVESDSNVKQGSFQLNADLPWVGGQSKLSKGPPKYRSE